MVDLLMRVRPAQLCEVLKACLRISRIECTASTNCRYWIDPVSIFGVALARSGIHEEALTRLLQGLLREGDRFVDIGANEGYFSILAGTLVGHGRVYAIEPQSRLQQVLRKNVELNGLRNVQLEQLAITDAEGQVNLLLRPSTNTGASSLIRHWKLGGARERVSATTLDRFFSDRGLERVRLLKVDCEGAESFVFREANGVLGKQSIDYIALEYHPTIIGAEGCRRIHDAIVRHGYRLAKPNGLSVYHSAAARAPAGTILNS